MFFPWINQGNFEIMLHVLDVRYPDSFFKYVIRTRCSRAGGPSNWYLFTPGEIEMCGVERTAGGSWSNYVGNEVFRNGRHNPVGNPFFLQHGQEPILNPNPVWERAIYGDYEKQLPPLWLPVAEVHAHTSLSRWLRGNFLPEHWPNFPFDMRLEIQRRFGGRPRPKPARAKVRSAMRAEATKE